jgi:hypothetical protein
MPAFNKKVFLKENLKKCGNVTHDACNPGQAKTISLYGKDG